MSTLVTQTELLHVPKMAANAQLKAEKRERFVRSSSIEKIIKFNAYICSQNYFILPAILAWLKTSQSVLHANVEKIIFFIKSLFFNKMVYRILESKVELVAQSVNQMPNTSAHYFVYYRDVVRLRARRSAERLYDFSEVVYEKLFVLTVYFTAFVVFAQALLCVSYMSSAFLTGGPTFLCICLYFMLYIYLMILLNYLKRVDENTRSDKKCDDLMPKKKLLKLDSNRTLSSLNLL